MNKVKNSIDPSSSGRMVLAELAISAVAGLITIGSVVYYFQSSPGEPEVTSKLVAGLSRGIRVVALILIETTLAYGFGVVLAAVSSRRKGLLEPLTFATNIVICSISAWASLFNIFFLLVWSDGIDNLTVVYIVVAAVALLNITLLALHLTQAQFYSSQETGLVGLIQALGFALIGIGFVFDLKM